MELIREEWKPEDYLELRAEFRSQADPEYRDFQSSLQPGDGEMIGVRLPVLREYARLIAKGNWRSFLQGIRPETYEETVLMGAVIGRLSLPYPEFVLLADDYTNRITGWAICDSFVSGLKSIKKYRREYRNQIPGYLKSSNPWKVRYALVVLLTYYADEEYAEDSLAIAASVDSDDYYVQMADAWLISMLYLVLPEQTTELIRYGLTEDVRKMTIRKILDSTRVKAKDKAIFRRMH